MLDKKDILFILKSIAHQTIVEPTKKFPYRIVQEAKGYSEDKFVSALQTKLSIMLQAAGE